MKRFVCFLLCGLISWAAEGQKKNFSYKVYGQVRGDLFYNSRANAETVDGLFYLYPKDKVWDEQGKDLNATPNGSFYLLYSRLGVDITGPQIGTASTKVKVEADFRGAGSNFGMLRIRHAYVDLDWGKSSVLIGQTWHPLFGEVAPQVLNLSTGAPFQPFNRSPLLRYRYRSKEWQWTAAAIWQLQYLSAGPDGKSEAYIKNSCIPEFYVGGDYKKDGWIAGAGVEVLSLVPRISSIQAGEIYKVKERITTVSAEAHIKYVDSHWVVAAKTLLASNLTHTSMIGGYAVRAVDARTGEQEYTPFRHSMTWLNVVYGKKWKPGLFVGYMKNMGTADPIAGTAYGVGVDLDQLLTVNLQCTYNLPHWKIGVEYGPSTAWYGSQNPQTGRVNDTHAVTNHRLLGVLIYMF